MQTETIESKNPEKEEKIRVGDELKKAESKTEKEPVKKSEPKKKPGYGYKDYSCAISYPTEVHKLLAKIAEKRKVTIQSLYREAIAQFVKKNS